MNEIVILEKRSIFNMYGICEFAKLKSFFIKILTNG